MRLLLRPASFSLILLAPPAWGADRASGPTFDGADASRPHAAITLHPVATGFDQPTDVQAVPGQPDRLVVLGKAGTAWWVVPSTGEEGVLFTVPVRTASEEGLLGIAFHPKFAENGMFYLDYVPKGGQERTRIEAWAVDPGADVKTAKPAAKRVILEQEQPYSNHDAGQLQFGPDGMLYVGFGDGGSAGDPHGNGQDRSNWLGDMLRIDVDHAADEQGYAVPPDNPFVGQSGVRPEIWAYGLRNPWRYAFAPDGRLVVADVGQDTWEEVDLVAAGADLGWNVREARHCFHPAKDCPTAGLTDPIYEYSHQEGISITGGYVYTGKAIPALAGKYVFGDFGTGRLWAIDLPKDAPAAGSDAPLATATSLGRWTLSPSTFGRGEDGELYVADFQAGTLYRVEP